jgi:hypothetical protein
MVNWLDTSVSEAERMTWLTDNRATKVFFSEEPSNNIDQFGIPYWFAVNDFYDSFAAKYGEDAKTIIGDTTKPVVAGYFVVHDTSGGPEPNTVAVDADKDTRGINLFIGTEKTVFRPHKTPGIANDWHTVGWGTMVGNKRKEEFVHTELSPYNNYETMEKRKYQDSLQIEIDGIINSGTNFTIRQYELLAFAYLVCSLRKGAFLTVTTHREVDFSYSSDAHGDPVDFDFDYFYQLIGSFCGLADVTFGIQRDRAYYHNQVNLDGFTNEFWPFVNHMPGVRKANQYGIPKPYKGNPKHLYINEL